MALLEIKRRPTPGELRWFGVLLGVFVALAGCLLYWRFQAPAGARSFWMGGGALVAIYFAAPRARRWIYLGWLYGAFPLGWTLSHALLAATYYLVLTPTGLLVRLFRGDPLDRRPSGTGSTYWVARRPAPDARRYLRQF